MGSCRAEHSTTPRLPPHAAFRRRLYDHDVVPEAKVAAISLI